jgi:hypothetical protein
MHGHQGKETYDLLYTIYEADTASVLGCQAEWTFLTLSGLAKTQFLSIPAANCPVAPRSTTESHYDGHYISTHIHRLLC